MPSNSEVRKTTLATLDEIVTGETAMRRRGIDVTDEDEWMQLGDIVKRIERRLRSAPEQPNKSTEEPAA